MKEKSKRTRSQVGKYSRRKGGQYEGKISKMLSKWWFGEEGILRKTPRSGGWSNKFPFDITIVQSSFENKPAIPSATLC